jgi:hypothetical protein
MMRYHRTNYHATLLPAQECARIVVAEGIQGFGTATRKATSGTFAKPPQGLEISGGAILLNNTVVEQVWIDHQRLFHAGHQTLLLLRDLLETALEAPHFLACFRPRLVNPSAEWHRQF